VKRRPTLACDTDSADDAAATVTDELVAASYLCCRAHIAFRSLG
jgi:hypothetical protein